MEDFLSPQQKRTGASTDIQNKKKFEIDVLEFYHLHKIATDKLKVLAGLDHTVHFLKIIWRRLPCVIVLFISFRKVKF